MTWEEIVAKLLESGQALGSKAFEISLLQVYNVVRIDAIWASASLIALVVFLIILRKSFKEQKDRWDEIIDVDDKPEFYIGLFGSIVCGFLFSALITNIVMYLGNPQWYAARWLLEDLLGK